MDQETAKVRYIIGQARPCELVVPSYWGLFVANGLAYAMPDARVEVDESGDTYLVIPSEPHYSRPIPVDWRILEYRRRKVAKTARLFQRLGFTSAFDRYLYVPIDWAGLVAEGLVLIDPYSTVQVDMGACVARVECTVKGNFKTCTWNKVGKLEDTKEHDRRIAAR